MGEGRVDAPGGRTGDEMRSEGLRDRMRDLAGMAPPTDPPGVDDVMRRRRTRARRRRALEGALVIAVVGVTGSALLALTGLGRSSPPLVPGDTSSGRSLPSTAVAECDGTTIRLLTPIVRSSPDGVHIVIDNRSSVPLTLWVRTGANAAPKGRAEVLSPLGTAWQIPPGEAVISCKGESDAQAVLEIADPEGLWRPFELPCPDRVGFMSRYHMGDGDPTDPVDQARSYFAEFLKKGDIVERAGYPEAARPIVRIVRSDEIMAMMEFVPDSNHGWLVGTALRCTSFR
jgi:hypothetical protein